MVVPASEWSTKSTARDVYAKSIARYRYNQQMKTLCESDRP